MKIIYPVIGAGVTVLALTSKAFAHVPPHQKAIAAALIIAVFSLIGFVAGRARRPKSPATNERTSTYTYSGGTRRL